MRNDSGTKQAHGYAVVVCDADVCAVVEEEAGGVDVLDCVQWGIAIGIGDVDIRTCRVCGMYMWDKRGESSYHAKGDRQARRCDHRTQLHACE
jgi:hypothetical protein